MNKEKKITERTNEKGQRELLSPNHDGLWYNPKLNVSANKKARKRNKK